MQPCKRLSTSFKFLYVKHPTPYKLSWFKQDNEVPFTFSTLLSFCIGGCYLDNVWCDMVPMDACQILLGCLWQYDRCTIHDSYINTFTFYKDNVRIMLGPTHLKLHTIPIFKGQVGCLSMSVFGGSY